MLMKIMTLLVFCGLLVGGDAQAAKNDCPRTSSRIEKLICSDEEVAALDAQLKSAYDTALQSGDTDAIKEEQTAWIKAERNVCKDVACLKSAYASRLTALGWAAEASSKYSLQNPLVTLMPSGETVQYSGDVKQKSVELVGSIEEFRDSVGGGYRLSAGGKQYTLRYTEAMTGDQVEVFSKLASSHQKVTAKGMVNIYKDGSAEYSDQTPVYVY